MSYRPALICSAACGLLLAAQAASAATMYRWTDAQGTVHYAQTPPPGVAAQAVESKPALSPGPAPADDSTQQFLQQAADEDEQKRKAKEAAAKQKSADAERCQVARSRLAFLDERPPGRLSVRDADGQTKRMDSVQWENDKAKARTEVEKSCKP